MESRKKNIGVLGAFALSVGTSIGWGSFVVTGNNYLSNAGLLGSIIGIVIAAGMASRRKSETFVDVFRRADDRMYVHKGKLKEIRPSHVLR